MPIIHSATDRGLRLLPWLTGAQALGLLATGALVWLAVRAPWAEPLRVVGAAVAGVGGVSGTLGRWPPGGRGEPIASWLRWGIRFVLRPRVRAGGATPGWDGLLAVQGDVLRHRQGWSVLVEIGGADFALRGAGASAAAAAAFREVLHALPSSLQVVNMARMLVAGDRPAHLDPGRAPVHLAELATAYRGAWQGLVETRGVVVRRCVLVLTDSEPGDRLRATEAALLRCAQRLGVPARRVRGRDLLSVLRRTGGGADGRVGSGLRDPWRVGLRRA